jgi:hypothetical protein
MSFVLPQSIQIDKEERRTCYLQLSAYSLRGNSYTSVSFLRESVYLTAEGIEIKRVQDSQPIEFTPDMVSQEPALQQAIATIYMYLDGADPMRPQAQGGSQ